MFQVVDIPSGYLMLQPDGNKIVRSGVIPEMRDSDVTKPGKTVWYFDNVPNYTQCFDHTVRRYFPVANITRYNCKLFRRSPDSFHFQNQTCSHH